MQTPDFLKNDVQTNIDSNTVQRLQELIEAYDKAKEKVNIIEQQLKTVSSEFNLLAMNVIPEFLLIHGITEMKLTDGRKVTIKEDISPTVKDEFAFRKWLHERKEDDILKVKYEFGHMENDKLSTLTDFLINFDYDFTIDESIHAQTKKKYFKELLATMSRDDLPEWVSIYDIRTTVIK